MARGSKGGGHREAAALALLSAEGVAHEVVPLGDEWFLLGKAGGAAGLNWAPARGD